MVYFMLLKKKSNHELAVRYIFLSVLAPMRGPVCIMLLLYTWYATGTHTILI